MNYMTFLASVVKKFDGGILPLQVVRWVNGVLDVKLYREPSASTPETWVDVKIPAPEVVEVQTMILGGKKVRTCVLKVGARTRRIAQAGIRSKLFSALVAGESDAAQVSSALVAAKSLCEGDSSSFDWDDIEFISWDKLWLQAVIDACEAQLTAPFPTSALIQGHFDKIVGGLVKEKKVVRGAHQTEVWAHSLACLVNDWSNVNEISYLAAVASSLGFELGATPKSQPGKEFISKDYVRRMSFLLGGFSKVDMRGLRELSSGLRNAERIVNPSGNEHLPEVWRDRVTYLNTVVAEIPGVTSSYAGKSNTGGQMLLLGDSSLEVCMTKSTILQDSPEENIFTKALAYGLSESEVIERLEFSQVGGGITRAVRVEEELPNPELVKLSIMPFGPKGMATRTSRRFVELRPDGYHFLQLVVAPDDVVSKKAGAMLVSMACEHAGVATTPSTTVEEIIPVLQSKLQYTGVPIFELIEGENVLFIDDSKVMGTLVPVLDDEGNQLVAATGHVPVAVMPEGEHYGKSIRGNVEVSSSPWAIVPNGLPLPEIDPVFHLLDMVGGKGSSSSGYDGEEEGSSDLGF